MQVWSVDPVQQIGTQQQQSGSSITSRGPSAPPPITRCAKSTSPSNESVGEVGTSRIHDTVGLAPEKLLASPSTLKTTSDAFRTVMDPEKFSVTHTPFMLGPSFVPIAQKSVYTILHLSAPTLTEGYLAFLGLMTRYQRSPVMRRDEPDMFKAAKGLQCLRNVRISQGYEASSALFLGPTMYVFNVLTAPDSSTAHSIVQSALMSTKAWLPRLIYSPTMCPIIMTPILIDTVECLVRREIPIIRLPSTDSVIVDRYAGVCATLLPLLYDLCVYSHSTKSDALELSPEIYGQLADIERSVFDWKPLIPPERLVKHGRCEVLAMMTQAYAYRLAALLIIHRLRYPLGVEEETGRELGKWHILYGDAFCSIGCSGGHSFACGLPSDRGNV